MRSGYPSKRPARRRKRLDSRRRQQRREQVDGWSQIASFLRLTFRRNTRNELWTCWDVGWHWQRSGRGWHRQKAREEPGRELRPDANGMREEGADDAGVRHNVADILRRGRRKAEQAVQPLELRPKLSDRNERDGDVWQGLRKPGR